jgi:polysaccharide pyruvyl transferase WcaK-like protein
VLVIGAYGGEHIGDAAILGGVLLRLHRRHQTEEATLVSQRPGHSARLVSMLEVPVRVSVEDYQQSTIPGLLAEVDAVVFGGGPLMDLPKQLVRHLYTVALARRHGKPFIVEGIGAGPFLRRASAWIGRRLVRMAARITVRTAVDARAPLLRGLRPVVGLDPAFDYLETRAPALTRLPAMEQTALDEQLRDTQGRIVVAINVRPLRPDYTTGASATNLAGYTRFVEARFEERLAAAMRQFHQTVRPAPCFVFFPMNAIQFGRSDLRSAYRLKRLLRGDVDLRVWEGDPGIDGVVALLRRVDAAITMRFHATIFAASQQRPVIGVDYRPGVRDKVAALMSDLGRGDDCGRIDEVTTAWLLDRLTALTATARMAKAGASPGNTGERTLPPAGRRAPT